MFSSGLQSWLYTILFGLMAALVIGNNISHWYRSVRTRESTSFTLFIGAGFAVIAVLAAPEPAFKWLAIVPVLIDPGTVLPLYTVVRARCIKRRR
jgi:hypothetical protein